MEGFPPYSAIPTINIEHGAPSYSGYSNAWPDLERESNPQPYIVDADGGSGVYHLYSEELPAQVSVERFLADKTQYIPGHYGEPAKLPYADFNPTQGLRLELPAPNDYHRHSSPEGSNWSSSSGSYSGRPFDDSTRPSYSYPLPYGPGSPSETSSTGFTPNYPGMSPYRHPGESYGNRSFVALRDIQHNAAEQQAAAAQDVQPPAAEYDPDAPGETDDENNAPLFTSGNSQAHDDDDEREAPSRYPTRHPNRHPGDFDISRPSKRPRSDDDTDKTFRGTSKRLLQRRKDRVSARNVHRGRGCGNNINNTRERRFLCPLAPYSCRSRFSTKNEWKRHMTTQHIRPSFWRCDLCEVSNRPLSAAVTSSSASTPQSGSVAAPRDNAVVYHNDFNRKDLFSQHLRRMHNVEPDANVSKRARLRKKSTASTDAHKRYPPPVDAADMPIEELHRRCLVKVRSPPPVSACVFCDETFEGPGSWERRMDHVGEHVEKEAVRRGGGGSGSGSGGIAEDVPAWREDVRLREWLEREGLIKWDDKARTWRVGDGTAD